MNGPAIETTELVREFAGERVLGPVAVEIQPGDVVALVGPNGAGKSTFLRLVAGLLDPTSGSVRIFGHRPSDVAAREALSYVPDQPVFFDDLSLQDHAALLCDLHGVRDWKTRFDDLSAVFRLSDRRSRLPSTFSRGLKQKASVVLALLRPHRVLLIDEPFVGLDQDGRATLLAKIAEERARGVTVVAATHEPFLLASANTAVAMVDGRLWYDGPPDPSLLDAPA